MSGVGRVHDWWLGMEISEAFLEGILQDLLLLKMDIVYG